MREAAFKYTLPVEKAETRDDGLYLVGLASGPEIDGDGDRVTPEAIWDFAKQINDLGGIPLNERVPYVDAHAKDGVLRELGWVTKAWVTDSGHLGVEVRLDEESPAALYLHKQVMRGKKFGMSVAGKVLDWAYEHAPEIGKTVRTFKKVVLSEISNTSRPSWSHSLGTVIAKAIQDAETSESDAAVGDNVEDELQTEQETTEAPAVNENTEDQPAAESEETTEEATVDTEAAAEGEAAAEEPAAEETTEEEAEEPAAEEGVAEATAEETEEPVAAELTAVEALTGLARFMNEMLTKMGVEAPVMVAKTVSQDENEPTFEKALQERDGAIAELRGRVEDLQKSLTEATARIEELENSPAGDDAPDLVEKHDLSVDEIAKAMDAMSPGERLRLGLRFGLKPSR